MVTSSDRPTATKRSPYLDAVLLVLPQVLLWPFAQFWVVLHEMSVAGCGPVEDGGNGDCDYALADAANVGLWIALPVIALLSFIALVACGNCGWRRWPVALAGIGLILVAVYLAIQVIYRAFLVA